MKDNELPPLAGNGINADSIGDGKRGTVKVSRHDFRESLLSLKFTSGQENMSGEMQVYFHKGHAFTGGRERVHMVPCPVRSNGTFYLKHLLSALNGRNEEVKITWRNGRGDSDKKTLTIVNGLEEIRLKGSVAAVDGVKMFFDRKLKWFSIPKGFFDYVDILERTVSKDSSNFQLSSIHCTPVYIEAACGSQICRFYHDLPDDFDFLIRGGMLKRIPPKAILIARTQNYCCFKYNTGLVIAISISNESYLESVSRNVKTERIGCAVRLPFTLLESIKKAESFTDEPLICMLREGAFLIASHGNDERYIAKAKIDYTGDEVSFMIEPKVLCDVIKFNQEFIITDYCIQIKNEKIAFITGIKRV